MTALLDIDQLRTFVAIAETGSFTRAADVVHKTQSAVSMQMKRLEERIGKPIFERDGRSSKLTVEGERLLDYARRIVRLNSEAIMSVAGPSLSGGVKLGVPDDYAERYLPEVMARFARSHPDVELTVQCEPTIELVQLIDRGEIDLAIVTHDAANRPSEVIRRERMMWVTSSRHAVHLEEPLPLALTRPISRERECPWRRAALPQLEGIGKSYRVLYTSRNSAALSAAVLAGLAVSVFPESAIRPGMRVLGSGDGFPSLPSFDIGLLRNPHEASELADALATHIIQGLDNLADVDAEAAE
jgi:DNA-binding transcriptional LysR family regulator